MFGNEFDENYYLMFTDNFSSRISISHLFILYSSNFLIHLSKIEFVRLENFFDSAKYKKKNIELHDYFLRKIINMSLDLSIIQSYLLMKISI